MATVLPIPQRQNPPRHPNDPVPWDETTLGIDDELTASLIECIREVDPPVKVPLEGDDKRFTPGFSQKDTFQEWIRKNLDEVDAEIADLRTRPLGSELGRDRRRRLHGLHARRNRWERRAAIVPRLYEDPWHITDLLLIPKTDAPYGSLDPATAEEVLRAFAAAPDYDLKRHLDAVDRLYTAASDKVLEGQDRIKALVKEFLYGPESPLLGSLPRTPEQVEADLLLAIRRRNDAASVMKIMLLALHNFLKSFEVHVPKAIETIDEDWIAEALAAAGAVSLLGAADDPRLVKARADYESVDRSMRAAEAVAGEAADRLAREREEILARKREEMVELQRQIASPRTARAKELIRQAPTSVDAWETILKAARAHPSKFPDGFIPTWVGAAVDALVESGVVAFEIATAWM
jgi:hypothetical protein